jgi:phosphoglycolate phosphatase
MVDTAITDIPAAILFDWDGTLVNTLPGLRKAHNYVRTSYGFEDWTEAEFRANLRHSARELYPRIYKENAAEAIERLYNYVRETHLAELEVIDGAPELLEMLRDAGIETALISNKRHDVLTAEVEHLGWTRYFRACVGAGQAAKDKPAADPVRLALERGGMRMGPDALWYVGDTVTDLQVAAAFGCRAVLLLDGEDKGALIAEYKPYLVFEDCRALQKAFAGFLERSAAKERKEAGKP